MGIISDIDSHVRRSARRAGKIKDIKSDPNTRSSSVTFGVMAIVQELFVVLCGAGAAFLVSLSAGDSSSAGDNGFIIILALFGGVILAVVALGLLIAAFINVCVQLSINKRAVGWFALFLILVCLVAVGFCVLFFLDK